MERNAVIAEQDICRLCLSTLYELHQLFPGDGTTKPSSSLMLKIRMLAEVMLSPSEEQEARICSCCVQKLEDFHKFRQTCKSSDGQIRKMRASRKRLKDPEEDSVASSKTQMEEVIVANPPNHKLGGVFDLVEYCEDMLVPGEYRLLFQGFVYQSDSLLGWRCELAEWKQCRSQLLIEEDLKKFRVHAKHSHGKICKDDDGRTFAKIQPKIRQFLEKIQQRHSVETKQEIPENDSKEVVEKEQQIDKSKLKLVEQQSRDPPKKLVKPKPFESSQGRVQISKKSFYNKPMITKNGFTYFQQPVRNGVNPELIRWRCEAPKCLGLVVTSKDLKQFTLRKAHTHAPNENTLANGTNVEDALPATLVAKRPLALRKVTSHRKNQSPKAPIFAKESNVKEVVSVPIMGNTPVVIQEMTSPPTTTNPVADVTLAEKPSETSCILPDHRFFRTNDGSYHMHFENHQYKRDFAHSPVGGETLWRCTTSNCGGSLLAFNYMKQLMAGRPHNHEPQGNVSDKTGDQKSPSASTENSVFPGPQEVAFYRSPSNVITLMYNSFSYRLKVFLPTGRSDWNCTWTKCDGLLRAGPYFECLNVETKHSHNAPPTVVMPQRWIPVGQAFKELMAKGTITDEMRRKMTAPVLISSADVNEILIKKKKLGNKGSVKGKKMTKDVATVSIIQTGK